MTEEDRLAIATVLDALERLMRMFQAERILYLLGTFASLLLFLYSGYKMFSQGTIESQDVVIVFGASGISSLCTGGVGLFLNRAFKLLEDIVRRMVST